MSRSIFRRTWAVLTLLVAGPAVAIADAPPPLPGAAGLAVAGLESQLLADLGDGQLDQFSLLEAGLIASGVRDEAKLAEYSRRLAEIGRRLAEEGGANSSGEQRGRTILRVLHREVLTGPYQASCTEVPRTLDEGRFNCVTATLLYRCLAARVGLGVVTLSEPDHVYCRLDNGSGWEIQTTTPLGFGGIATQHGTGPADATAAAPPARSRRPRELTDGQLVAKIYFNRGRALLASGNCPTAWGLLQISSRLDPADEIARQCQWACLNNWALAAADAEDFSAAAALLAYGVQAAPEYRPFRDNELYIHHRWVTELCRAGHFAQALELLEAGYRQRPDVPLYAAGRLTVCRIWRQTLAAAGKERDVAALDTLVRTRLGT